MRKPCRAPRWEATSSPTNWTAAGNATAGRTPVAPRSSCASGDGPEGGTALGVSSTTTFTSIRCDQQHVTGHSHLQRVAGLDDGRWPHIVEAILDGYR